MGRHKLNPEERKVHKNVTVQAEDLAALQALQERLSERLGFRVTHSQVIQYLIKHCPE
jgi:mannose/fructose/N-acetylgalactosamine-specific phosphotransferase system component IIB